jgi:VIT1/CCC1 family predicted Fe2+/Mn2+ transporter
VALVASVPFLVLDGEDALSFTLVLLAALTALTGLAIARLRGRSWVESVTTAGIVFGIAVLVVVVKVTLGH